MALQFKKAYPAMFDDYNEFCKAKKLNFGNLHIHKISYIGTLIDSLNKAFDDVKFVPQPIFIINFPTKNHWKEKSKLENIELGLQTLVMTIKELKIKSIALPMLGCGLGGLESKEVKSLFKNYLVIDKVIVLVYYN